MKGTNTDPPWQLGMNKMLKIPVAAASFALVAIYNGVAIICLSANVAKNLRTN